MSDHAIPYRATVGTRSGSDPLHVGTAFLATTGGIRYLVSAAHVPSGAQPTTDWTAWEPSMTVRHPGGEVSFDLFATSAAGERTPAFAYRPTDADPTRLHDVMWFPFLLEEWTAFGDLLSTHFTVFDLDQHPTPGLLTAYGFPYANPWPQLDTAKGQYVRTDGLLHVLSAPSKNGYSGGPVVDTNGQLHGMLIASTDAHGTGSIVVPTEILRYLINDYATTNRLTPPTLNVTATPMTSAQN